MKKSVKVLGGITLAFLVGRGIGAQEAHVNPQVVFKLDHRDDRGRYVLEAQYVRIAYTVSPIEGDNPAPLPENIGPILCRPYNEGPKLYLHCGGYRYKVDGIGLIPKE